MSHRSAPVAILLLGVLAALASGCWIEDGFNGSRSNWNPSETRLTPENVASIHRAAITPITGDRLGSPFTDGRRVYVRSVHGDPVNGLTVVQAFDPHDLHLLWTAPKIFGGGGSTSITIAGDRLLVPSDLNGDGDAIVYELDAATGATLAEDRLGNGVFIPGSIAYDGTTAALVARTQEGAPFLWFGNPGNATGHTFTNLALVPAVHATPPAISGGTIIVGGDDHAYGFQKDPAGTPTGCTFARPCLPKWASPALPLRISEFLNPIVLDPHRVLVSHDVIFGNPKAILDVDTGALVWMANYPSDNFNGNPAATDTAMFTEDQSGRVFVHSSSDCTTGGAPPTCLPTKVLVPDPLSNGTAPGLTPLLAGRLAYVQTELGIDVFDMDCPGSGSDPVSHLPRCGPVAVLPIRFGEGNRLIVSEGSVYITSSAGLERWSVDS